MASLLGRALCVTASRRCAPLLGWRASSSSATFTDLPETHAMLKDTCRQFADGVLAKNAGIIDKYYFYKIFEYFLSFINANFSLIKYFEVSLLANMVYQNNLTYLIFQNWGVPWRSNPANGRIGSDGYQHFWRSGWGRWVFNINNIACYVSSIHVL